MIHDETRASTAQDRQRFGELLREFRLAAGLSQEALAELATLSANAIGALERGTNQAPQRDTLELLISALSLEPHRRHALERAAKRPSKPRKTRRHGQKNNNLPSGLMRLYGREEDLDALKALIDELPLVTLSGTGGVGKTRLALQIGEMLVDDFSDGVWFVDLAPLRDPALVPSAVALVFGIRESSDRPLAETLARELQRKHLLLILDNCEHLVEAGASLVQGLIRDCPDVRILATSRQSLAVHGEQTYRVASLQLDAAVDLFAEHAKRAADWFELSEDNMNAVERIVRRLDGIPLAIELAAAHVKLLSPDQINELLAERFQVLTGASNLELPRHQTMRATIDWSYALLNAEEKCVLHRLSVFSGGFTLEAAEAVCADERMNQWRIVELLASLVDKSLVASEPAGIAQRYRLLLTMRQYAAEKAAEDSATANMRQLHAEYYAKLVECSHCTFSSAPSVALWARSLEPELENFRTALEWTLRSSGDAELGARLLTKLQEFWLVYGLPMEAARRAQSALHLHPDLPKHLRAALWLTLARMLHEFRMLAEEMLEAATRARDLYASFGDRADVALSLRERGIARLRLGNVAEAREDMERSLDIYRELGDLRMISRGIGVIASLLLVTRDFDEAKSLMEEALRLACDAGDERNCATLLVDMSEADFGLGNVRSAVERARKNLAHDETLRKNVEIRVAQESNLAVYLLALGHEEEARRIALSAIHNAHGSYAAIPLQIVAATLARHDPRRAALLLGYVEKVFQDMSFTRENTEQYAYDCLTSTLDRSIGHEETCKLMGEGAAITEVQAVKLARRKVDSHETDIPSHEPEYVL